MQKKAGFLKNPAFLMILIYFIYNKNSSILSKDSAAAVLM